MRKSALFGLVLVACSTQGAFAQQSSYSFKGNALGMSLQDFKSANNGADVLWVEFRDAKGKKKKEEVPTPVCSDQFDGLPSFNIADRVDGEVLCDASPGNRNPDGRTILDGSVVFDHILYRFYNGRLYQIDMAFPAFAYDNVRDAFVQKYGAISRTTHDDYQNGFGAHWMGENVFWSNGRQAVMIGEGSGNGPAQDGIGHPSIAIIVDNSLKPKMTGAKSEVDF